MITILLVEDNTKDAKRISALLDASLSIHYKFTLIHKTGTVEALSYLSDSSPDLILMDLEMKEENQTTLGIIEQVPGSIPIIVISHLSHYQKPSLRHGNVFDFVPKSNLDDRLISRILQVLSPKNGSEPESIIFPAVIKGDVSESIPIYKISYIHLVGRGRYEIHLSDNRILLLRSVLFKELLRQLKEQHIVSLQPVSRNEIVNINHISRIKRTPAGRIELTILGADDHPFNIGKEYERFFEEEFM